MLQLPRTRSVVFEMDAVTADPSDISSRPMTPTTKTQPSRPHSRSQTPISRRTSIGSRRQSLDTPSQFASRSRLSSVHPAPQADDQVVPTLTMLQNSKSVHGRSSACASPMVQSPRQSIFPSQDLAAFRVQHDDHTGQSRVETPHGTFSVHNSPAFLPTPVSNGGGDDLNDFRLASNSSKQQTCYCTARTDAL